jgi:nicotinate-nucleotide--dimethylbenzimidazole phosphoribosyltransferase
MISKKIIGLPDHIEPLGYFLRGASATDYDDQPMLQQLKWRERGITHCLENHKSCCKGRKQITKNKV